MEKFLAACFVLITAFTGYTAYVLTGFVHQDPQANVSGVVTNFYPTNAVSSSTVFTLNQTSQRLLATTTGSSRIFASIQTMNCTTAGTLFLNLNSDKAATVSTGPNLLASSTLPLRLGTYDNPVTGTSVQGIVDSGTCKAVVTEWLH